MKRCSEIREICGDWAFDIIYNDGTAYMLLFNSRRNAMTVKRCLEVDWSIPNAATPVDFVEVVRCRNCKYFSKSAEIEECRRCGDCGEYCGICHYFGVCVSPYGYYYRGKEREENGE